MEGVAHKFYIHTEALQFYQCRKNLTFIFQLLMWDKPHLLQLQHASSRVDY